jgi:DmsE family decaheme c-type cytochrome
MTDRIPYRYVFAFLVAGSLLVALPALCRAAASAQDKPRVSRTCLDCHTGKDSTLAATGHRLAADAPDGPQARVACTDCHAGDSRHWEEDPKQYPMTDPSRVGAGAEAHVCAACHQNAHQQNMLEKNVHVANDVNCSGCHGVHKSTQPALLKKAESGLCLDCHTDVAGQFARPYRHPVADQVLQCSDCHMTLDQTRRPLSRNGTNVCTRCHAAFEGPFPYEHPATLDYSTEEGGCIACHDPHGSALPKMLKQPYEAPHFQLCTQCHWVPRHNQNPMHGTQWAGMPCNECHADIHGSYVSHLFLSESLQARGCFNSGCHKF